MEKKQMLFKIKGMNQDLSVSSFNPEFAFENRNLRLSTNENNTLMSWVNERGTLKISLYKGVDISLEDSKYHLQEFEPLIGTPIGTAVINHKLVVFTTNNNGLDRIYVIFKTKATVDNIDGEYYINTLIFLGNLEFNTEYPLETLVSYESSEIEKVYWTDNKSQPRFINIIKYMDNPVLYSNNPNDNNYNVEVYTKFNFVAAADLNSSISVEKRLSGGVFAPGVIQYCYTYYNKNAQQSNIINVSPLYYLTHSTRGAKADDTVNNSFLITIKNPDPDFDMVRLYSIQRTSWNATPYVRSIEDFPIVLGAYDKTNDIIYVDTGTSGASVDPTEMLFLGGREITALTMEEKDLTLFLGNIGQKDTDMGALQNIYKDSTELIHFYTNVKETNFEQATITVLPELWRIQALNLHTVLLLDVLDYISDAFPITMGDQTLTVFNHYTIVCSNSIPLDGPVEITYTKAEEIKIDLSPKEYHLNNPTGTVYNNTFRLNDSKRDITTFKGGDYYRFGFQLQKYTGEWTEPIYIQDAKNTKYPVTSVFDEKVYLPYAQTGIDLNNILVRAGLDREEFSKTYKRIRPLIVYPDANDRCTICQGVLNPTVFNVLDREEKLPYALASWYFRPYSANINDHYNYNIWVNKYGTNVLGKDIISVIESSESASTTTEEESTTTTTETATRAEKEQDGAYYSIMLLRIKATSLYHYLKHQYVDFESGGGEGDEQYSYYGALKLATVKVLDNEDDTEYTEFCDVLFFFDAETSASKFMSIRRSISGGHNWGCPEWKALRLTAWSLYNSTSGKLYRIPDIVLPGPNGFLEYVGTKDSCTFNFLLEKPNFDYDDYDLHRNYVGSYTITFNKGISVGSGLPYIHYSSLISDYSHENITYSPFEVGEPLHSDHGEYIKQTEILGSIDKYLSPYSISIINGANNSNTQFFIDLSIVTLNSPDLDFDTQAQNSISENLKLRIVGVIPITASASAHNIATTTSMLPLNYQTEEDEDGNIKAATEFGRGELQVNTFIVNKNENAGKHLVSDYLWEDAFLSISGSKVKDSFKDAATYLVYPWQASRSLTNDKRAAAEATSTLKTKVLSNLLYSYNSSYFVSNHMNITCDYSVDTQIHLSENDYIYNLRLPKHGAVTDDINYYPNIDKALVNDLEWRSYTSVFRTTKELQGGVLMRYKSGTHAVVSLKEDDGTNISILPYIKLGSTIWGEYLTVNNGLTTFWGEKPSFYQNELDISALYKESSSTLSKKFDTLLLAELYRDIKDTDVKSLFGGTGEQAIKANNWLVGGEALPIELNNDNTIKPITLTWTEGDTYYQRYDCLKTYPFSDQDPNLIVEILSFMCETHVNLDGRYDRNRGLRDNTMMSPTNFNLMNPVYNQLDNFFSYKIGSGSEGRYPNLITFTKTKESGADIDQWTNITLASNLELDGSKGEISSILRLNNQLFAFQDSGISQILYNESVLISSTEGVPIEIANSLKVQGKRYISNSIGCSNKYSICNTPSGIYFIDSNDKSIQLFTGELKNISNTLGFNTWCKKNIFSNKKWTPTSFDDFVTYYDRLNLDILFINKNECLAFSEKLAAFTSFYDYGSAPYFINLDDEGLWLKDSALWHHRGSEDYCTFFGNSKSYSMTLVGNPEPLVDKIFTNLEFRASVNYDGEYKTKDGKELKRFLPTLPFDDLEVWNEYQHGTTIFKNKDGHSIFLHHTKDKESLLKRKFRIWRCDIPRDNEEVNDTEENPRGIYRFHKRAMDRMRNPWIYLKLKKDTKEEDSVKNRTEIHDIVMTYFS